MAEAVLGAVAVRGRVPEGLGPDAAARLRQALDAVPALLTDGLAPLAEVDPGAYWVLKELNVRLSVPASDPDPRHQARRIAGGLAEAIEEVVRRGPSAEAVRFTGRAAFVASYVRARTSGAGVGWVFDRLAVLDALPPGDALVAAARLVDVSLIDVVAELAGPAGGWSRLIPRMDAAAAGRLVAALGREASGMGAPAAALARARGAWAELVGGLGHSAARGRGGAADRLAVLGALGSDAPLTAADVAAVWAAVPETAGPLAGRRFVARRGPDGEPGSAKPGAPGEPAFEPDDSAGFQAPPTSFASPGVAAFLLLPDLGDLLRDGPLAVDRPPAAAVRAAILAGVFGGATSADDPAVALASGLKTEPDAGAVAALIAGPLTELTSRFAADPVLGHVHEADRERFAAGPLGLASAALFRAFARHLHGFGRASAAHLMPRVLPPGGRVHVTDEVLDAVLPQPQLAVLLALAGLDAFACRPAWLAERVLVSHEVPGSQGVRT